MFFLYDYRPVEHNKSGSYDQNKIHLSHNLQKIFPIGKALKWRWSLGSEIVSDAKFNFFVNNSYRLQKTWNKPQKDD